MARARLVDSLWQDIHYALRTLGRQLGWTTVAVGTLGIGIGATTAMYGVVNSLVLHPLPYRAADRVAMLWKVDPRSSLMMSAGGETLAALEAGPRSIESYEIYQTADRTLTGRGEPALLHAAAVRSSFFQFTGVGTIVGRGFSPEETRPGGPRVAILSEGQWQTRFGGSKDVIGQRIELNDRPFTIIGVARRDLRLPSPWQAQTDVWVPFAAESLGFAKTVMVRLKPGVSVDRAEHELDALMAANRSATGPRAYRAKLMRPGDMVGFRDSLFLLAGAVALLLVVACANVAHLLVARGATRERELAIRVALGAGASRIGRQLVTESLILAAIGCVVGIAIGYATVAGLLAVRPSNLDALAVAAVDARTLWVAAGVAIATGIAFGCVAAIHAVRHSAGGALRLASLTGTVSRSRHRLRSFLVVTEMAVSAMLLVGAALVVRSVMNLQRIDPGFDTRDAYTLSVDLPKRRYPSDQQRMEFLDRLAAGIRSTPGVTSAAFTTGAPPRAGGYIVAPLESQDSPRGSNENGDAGRPKSPEYIAETTVAPDFFSVLRLPLLEGASFTEGAAKREDVIINASLAKIFWPGQRAVGKHIRFVAPPGIKPSDWSTVVAVVANSTVEGLGTDRDQPMLYIPMNPGDVPYSISLVVRVAHAFNPIAPLRRAAASLDPKLSPPIVRSIDDALEETIAKQKFTMQILAVFAGVAVILSAIGLYGVISYVVAQRTREIGIRIALGATPRNVARAVVARGLILSLSGLLLGLVASVWGTKLVKSVLYGVTPTDALSFAAAGFLLLAISVLACTIPMRRAMRVDPVIAMRGE